MIASNRQTCAAESNTFSAKSTTIPVPHDDPDDEDWYDGEDSDLDDATATCPECGAEIYADLDHCPQCGHWLTDADHRTQDCGTGFFSSRRVRLVALVMLASFVLALLLGILGRL
jgi:ribosomal protein S27AE